MNKNKKRPNKYHKRSGNKRDYAAKDAVKRSDKRDLVEATKDAEPCNNPAWYYFDAKIAEQVSQLSFQNLAGYPIDYDGKNLDVPNIVSIFLNPAPGTQLSSQYGSSLAQDSGMNMAAFRLFSKLSAFTGRTQTYAPQDVATMILAMGEVISQVEWIRRAFGISFVTNMRNRDYPRQVLEFGMMVDADDLFAHRSDYRTEFNELLMLINQLPIPKNVAYFDKCAKLYKGIYLDSPSSMAQTLIVNPWTTWILDEASYSGGTILHTVDWIGLAAGGELTAAQPMSYFLAILKNSIMALLNSSSLQVVYTDILNYANKVGCEFWKFDYLYEDYQVLPKYDEMFLLQMHNCTVCGAPDKVSTLVSTPDNVTPYNDVYPDPNKNCIFYNPCFTNSTGAAGGAPRTGNTAIIDCMNDAPTLDQRCDMTRFTSICKGKVFAPAGFGAIGIIDTALPDHYVAFVWFETQTSNLSRTKFGATLVEANLFGDLSTLVANIDWCPRFLEIPTGGNILTGHYTGDINFYTTVDDKYLRKLHNFVALALYDIRS